MIDLLKKCMIREVRGIRRKGRPRKCWMEELKETLGKTGLNIEEARVCVQDRNEWLRVCRGEHLRAVGEFSA